MKTLVGAFATQPNVAVAVRTLLVAGFTITGNHNQPNHTEIHCEKQDVLGARVSYLIALTDRNEFQPNEIQDINRTAQRGRLVPILIATNFGKDWISWEDFTEALGGAVPSWKALGPTYESTLLTASINQLPQGETGEAWLVFEDLVSVGLEFVFGKRVHRLGGRKRGRRVSDMQAQLPTGEILVVDAKAAKNGFDAAPAELRALEEYVGKQILRQKGQVPVAGALVVSSKFQQDDMTLLKTSVAFNADAKVPVTFLTAKQLADSVRMFRDAPQTRNGIKWNQLFRGGLFSLPDLEKEVTSVHDERVSKGR